MFTFFYKAISSLCKALRVALYQIWRAFVLIFSKVLLFLYDIIFWQLDNILLQICYWSYLSENNSLPETTLEIIRASQNPLILNIVESKFIHNYELCRADWRFIDNIVFNTPSQNERNFILNFIRHSLN